MNKKKIPVPVDPTAGAMTSVTNAFIGVTPREIALSLK
jgi:hypothetical protein